MDKLIGQDIILAMQARRRVKQLQHRRRWMVIDHPLFWVGVACGSLIMMVLIGIMGGIHECTTR